jgi:hypothetical protein
MAQTMNRSGTAGALLTMGFVGFDSKACYLGIITRRTGSDSEPAVEVLDCPPPPESPDFSSEERENGYGVRPIA